MAGAFNPDLGAGSAAPVGGTPTISGGAAAIGSALGSIGDIANSFIKDVSSRDKPSQSYLDNEALKPYAKELSNLESAVRQGKMKPSEAAARSSRVTSSYLTKLPGYTDEINGLHENFMGYSPREAPDKAMTKAMMSAVTDYTATEQGKYVAAAIFSDKTLTPEQQFEAVRTHMVEYNASIAAADARTRSIAQSTESVISEVSNFMPIFSGVSEAFAKTLHLEAEQAKVNNPDNQFAFANLLESGRNAYDRAMAEVESLGNHYGWNNRNPDHWNKVKESLFPEMKAAIGMIERMARVKSGETPTIAQMANEIKAGGSVILGNIIKNLNWIPTGSEDSDQAMEIALKVLNNLGPVSEDLSKTPAEQAELWRELLGSGEKDLEDFEAFVDKNLIAFAQIKKDPTAAAKWATITNETVAAAVSTAKLQDDPNSSLNVAVNAGRLSEETLGLVLKGGMVPTPGSVDKITGPNYYRIVDDLASFKGTHVEDQAIEVLETNTRKIQNIRDVMHKDLEAKLNYGGTKDVIKIEQAETGPAGEGARVFTMKVNPSSEVGKALAKEGFSLDQRGIAEFAASPRLNSSREREKNWNQLGVSNPGKVGVSSKAVQEIRELNNLLKGGGMASFNAINKLNKLFDYSYTKMKAPAAPDEVAVGTINSNSESPAAIEEVGEAPAKEVSFEDVIAPVLEEEGGYADDPDDRGGKTNFGITEATARRNGFKGDMKNLTKEEATKIYEAEYYAGPKIDKLPPEVRELAFDGAVNHGPATSIRFVQEAINEIAGEGTVDVDGKIGEATIEAANSIDPEELKVKTALIRRDYYVSIAKNKKSQLKYFRSRSGGKGGWIKRVEKYLPEDLRWDNEEFGAIVSEIQTA